MCKSCETGTPVRIHTNRAGIHLETGMFLFCNIGLNGMSRHYLMIQTLKLAYLSPLPFYWYFFRLCYTQQYKSPTRLKTLCVSIGKLPTRLRCTNSHCFAIVLRTLLPNYSPRMVSRRAKRQKYMIYFLF